MRPSIRVGRVAASFSIVFRNGAVAALALVVIMVVLSVNQDGFLTVANMQNVLQTNAPVLIVSMGVTFVVVSGGFDLSIGAMMALSKELLVRFVNDGQLNPLLPIVLTVVLCGIVGGLINGVAIGFLKLNFFVCTLAAMILIQGIVLVASAGNTEVIDSSWLQSLGNDNVGVVPVSILICLGRTNVAVWSVVTAAISAWGADERPIDRRPVLDHAASPHHARRRLSRDTTLLSDPGCRVEVMDVRVGGQVVVLAPVVAARLSAAGRVEALEGLARLRAWADAQEQHLLAAMAGPGDPPRSLMDAELVEKQFVREEIACVLRVAPVTVNARLQVAGELVRRLPETLVALERGDIGFGYARCLAEAVSCLPDEAATLVELRVLPGAGRQTLSAFRVSVARAVLAVDPRRAEEQHEDAVALRRVESRVLDHGMGAVYAELPADEVQAIMTRVQQAADALGSAESAAGVAVDQRRTADQLRADALVALVSGQELDVRARWQGRRPSVQVSVALSTLLGVDDEPGELDGYGPVPATLARRMAADPSGTWRRLVTDPLGGVIDVGRDSYAPPRDLAEQVMARDRVCRFPGCRRRARRCDLDHQRSWGEGGGTDECNLACLCARHHHLKHEAGWRVLGDPGGELRWVTPTGHSYLDPPGRYPVDCTMTAVATISDDDTATCPF